MRRIVAGEGNWRNDFCGVYPVFQTPFTETEEIDYKTLRREVDWLYDTGANGIVMAMVSEILRLSSEERDHLAAFACEVGGPRGQVIISVGAESSYVARHHAMRAEAAGAAAIMAIPPISIPLDPDHHHEYYKVLLETVEIPVIVQNASGYIGQDIPLDVEVRLLEEYGERVMFKPEAIPLGPRLSRLQEVTGKRATVFEGSGGIALVDAYQRGIVGTMPGADLSWVLVALWEALEKGDEERVNAINGPLCSLISLQVGLDGFLAVEKYLLVKQKVFVSDRVRGPRSFALDDQTRREVDRLFAILVAECNVPQPALR